VWVSWTRWTDEAVFAQVREWPSIAPRESDGQQRSFTRPPDRPVDVRGGAGAGDGEQRIGGARQHLQLLNEHTAEVGVVGDRGQCGGIGGERQRRKGFALLDDGVLELDRDVLRIAGGAAIPHHEQPTSPAEPFGESPDACLERSRILFEEAQLQIGALVRLAENGFSHALLRIRSDSR
jgi:hypothetical protein